MGRKRGRKSESVNVDEALPLEKRGVHVAQSRDAAVGPTSSPCM